MRQTRRVVLSVEEARVVACLVEKEATLPDTYPLTLNALRLACNQTSNRDPIVAWDDRTVENTLLSLKSMGLVRFVHPSHGGRTVRYRHVADERWRLSKGELAVLAVLVLRGAADHERGSRPHGAADRPRRRHGRGDPRHARGAQPGAVRGARRAASRRARAALGARPSPASPSSATRPRSSNGAAADDDTGPLPPPVAAEPVAPAAATNPDLARDVAELWLRVERLERLLGLSEDVSQTTSSTSSVSSAAPWPSNSSARLFMQ